MVEFSGKNIIIMCCSSCNIKCKHCYIEYKGNIQSQDLENIIQKLSKKYNITLNGSEILLNRDYLKILNLINQNRVTTNGLVIHNNDELLCEMKNNNIDTVGISYHFSLHDLVSSIEKQIILDDIEKLKENNFKVEIMTTISKINYTEIESMIQEAILLNANCIRFTNLFNEGNASTMDNNLLLDDEDINIFFDQFYICKRKYKDLIDIKRSGTFSRDLRKENSTYYCPSMETTIALAPNYKIYPCPFMIRDGYEIGKYEDGKIYIEDVYENDNTTCMLHNVFNRGKTYVKRRL